MRFFLLLVFSCFGGLVQAQEAMQTVTKKIAKTITCSPSTIITVTGEKSSIVVKGWNENFVAATITFSASHTNKKTAEHELTYMQYALVKEDNRIELRNGFMLPSSVEHIYSKLEVRIELMVPAGNTLQVSNKYGDIVIARFSGKTSADISMGDMNLTDLSGEVNIRAAYGGIRGSGIKVASLHCTDEQSKVTMELDEGNFFFNSKHGDLDLQVKQIKGLNVQAMRSDVTIRTLNNEAFRYNLSNNNGQLFLPGKYSQQLIKKGKQQLFISGAKSAPLIQVTSNYNVLTIN